MTKQLTKPVVFLDIDGVLNSNRHFTSMSDQALVLMSERDGDDSGYFNEDMVARLNRITDATEAVLVISSSWVNDTVQYPDVRAFRALFRKVGITGTVFDLTDREKPDRVGRINDWLCRWAPETPWVVIDDSRVVRRYAPRVVLTRYDEGLTDEDAAQAIDILLNPPPPPSILGLGVNPSGNSGGWA